MGGKKKKDSGLAPSEEGPSREVPSREASERAFSVKDGIKNQDDEIEVPLPADPFGTYGAQDSKASLASALRLTFEEWEHLREVKEKLKKKSKKKGKKIESESSSDPSDDDTSESSESSEDEKRKKFQKRKGKAKLEEEDLDVSSDENDENFRMGGKPVLFNGSNYAVWKKYIKGQLILKNLWKLVKGEERKPKDPKARKMWLRKDIAATTGLMQSCTGSVLDHFLTHSTAHECWIGLENQFEKGVQDKGQYVFQEFIQFKFKPNESIDEAVKRFNILVEQLTNLGRMLDEDHKLQVFLNGPDRKSVV